MILVECRSRALYSSEWGGRAGNWVDGVLLRKPAGPSVDEDRLLAKVGSRVRIPCSAPRNQVRTRSEAVFRLFGFQRGEPRQERKIGTDELRVSIIGWTSLDGSASGS